MKRIIAICSVLMLSTTAYAAGGCEQDYQKHNDNVISLISSTSVQDVQLGVAQRDCLALMLQDSSSLCETYREFRTAFLSLSNDKQRSRGQACSDSLAKITKS